MPYCDLGSISYLLRKVNPLPPSSTKTETVRKASWPVNLAYIKSYAVSGLQPQRLKFYPMWDHVWFLMDKEAPPTTAVSPSSSHSTNCSTCISHPIVESIYVIPTLTSSLDNILKKVTPTCSYPKPGCVYQCVILSLHHFCRKIMQSCPQLR
jgi:hypothetical protein